MAKKQTMKERHHESEGMKRYWHEKEGRHHHAAKARHHEHMEKHHHDKRGMRVPHHLEGREGGESFVDGHDPMIGHGDFANMPQYVDMRPFPRSGSYREKGLDDTIVGVDRTMSNDFRQTSEYLSNQK